MLKYMKKLLPILSIILLSCAYFNTFYNAKTYFHEAEKEYRQRGQLTPRARQNYNKVIEKCSKVIEFYPNSKYVDDALYLMGVSYYRMGQYDKAVRKFRELMKYYPNSKLTPEAKLMLARTYIKQGEYELARNLLGDTHSEEAELLLIDSFIESGEFQRAVSAIDSFIKAHPKSKYLRELHLKAAEVYNELGQPESALQHISKFLKSKPRANELRRALELRGDVFMKLGMPDSAIRAYEKVEFESPRDTNQFRIKLKIAIAYEETGDFEKAKSIYRELMEERLARDRGQEAGYRLGQLLEKSDSLEAALKTYEKASRLPGAKNEFKNLASKRMQALRKVSNISDSLIATDTTGKTALSLAEAYLFDLNDPQKAIEIYRSLYENNKGKPIGAKALYALIVSNLNFVGDTAAAKKWYQKLQTEYKNTVFASEAEKFWGKLFKNE